MLPLAVLTKNRTVAPRGSRSVGIAAGICAGGASIAFFQGLRFDPLATVIGISLFPVFTVLVGRLQYNDAIERRQIIGSVLAVIGTVCVVAGYLADLVWLFSFPLLYVRAHLVVGFFI